MNYSVKFRKHVLRIRAKEGLTFIQTALRFGVGVALIVRWANRLEPDQSKPRMRKPRMRKPRMRKPRMRKPRMRKIDMATLALDVAEWTCHGLVPGTYLIYAANLSNARGLLPPSVECLRRGL